MQQRIFDTGHLVGNTARRLFPGGVEVPFDVRRLRGMVRRTHELIDEGTRIVDEASFLFDNVFAAVDILCRAGAGWILCEVKSTTGIRDTFLDDAAEQAYVLESAGLALDSINLVHLNSEYVLDGDLDPDSLFTVNDVTGAARLRIVSIPDVIEEMKVTLNGPEPDRPIGPHCISPCGSTADSIPWPW